MIPISNYELRVCDKCDRQNIRPIREHRAGEVPCPCGSTSFTIYDAPYWYERGTPPRELA